jgi:hypothetical protein
VTALSPNSNRAYLLQPVSHPYDQQPQKVIAEETQIRPWLAWSPPAYMHESLNHMVPEVTFENANWQALLHGDFGPGDLTIDGSILAAKQIDTSYTPMHFNRSTPGDPTETHWTGIFAGAEKIWVGEPASLRLADETVIVIHDIIEKTAPNYSTNNPQQPNSTITLLGDIYVSITAPTPQLQPPNLPTRMTTDHLKRNQISATSPNLTSRQYHVWKLRQVSATVSLTDIKGRWYEWSTMLPILKSRDAHQHQLDLERGLVEPLGRYLNARNECRGTPGTRRNDRSAAFGASVPPTVKVREGTDVPSASELPVDPARQTLPPLQQSQGAPHLVGHNTRVMADAGDARAGRGQVEPTVELDDFMNLDGIEGGDWGGGGVWGS